MASIKVYVNLCFFVLCTCRPTENELPHSRDFYAGYIKALNDNFDALFKPERQTRSITLSEEKGGDAEQESRTKVLDELIDKNPQKRDEADTGVYKRDILSEDIMNTNTELEEYEKAEASNTAHTDVTIISDHAVEAQKKSVEIKPNITNLKDTNSTGKSEVSEIEDGINSEEDTSTDKKTIDEKDYNLDGENDSGDVASGNKKSNENNSDDIASSGNEINSDDLSSGDNDTSENTSADVASGSKITSVSTYTGDVKGDNGFEGKSEKREIRNIDEENNSASGNDDDGSSDTNINHDVTETQKRTIADKDGNDEDNEKENDKIETTNEKSKIVEDVVEISNNTTIEETKKDVINENKNEIIVQTEKTKNKKDNVVKKTVVDNDKKIEETQSATIEDKNDDDDSEETENENHLNLKEENKNVEDDNNDDNEETNLNKKTVEKKSRIVEDPTAGVETFKKDQDIQMQKKTVLYASEDASRQIKKKTVYKDEDEDDDEQFRKPSYHVVVGFKKTIVPITNNTGNVSMTNETKIVTHKSRRKSKVKHYHKYTPEKDITETSNKRVEEDVVVPDAFTTESEDDEDKALINAPEPTYISQIPGLETSTIEHFSDENQEATQDRGLSDRISYQSPVMYYARSPYSRNDYETLRRHFILEHASMQHLPYMPGIMSGYAEEQEERNRMPSERYIMSPPEGNIMSSESNMITPESHMAPPENSIPLSTGNIVSQDNNVINEQYSSGLPPSNQDIVSYRQTPYYSQYQQPPQTPYNAPMEQIQYVDKYAHGMEDGRMESNNQAAYTPENTNQVPGNTRSIVISNFHGKKHHHHHKHDSTVLKVPSTIVDRFIQNAAQIYQFGDELARNSHGFMENDRTGVTRSSVSSSREKYHEPVLLQPIVVLMPYGRSN